MNESAALECSQCGAPLELKGGDAQTVRCSYCGASVVVPEELREKKPAVRSAPVVLPARVVISAPAERPRGRGLLSCNAVIVLVVILLLTAVLSGAIYFISMRPAADEAERSAERPQVQEWAEELSEVLDTVEPPSFAQVEFSFGGEGTGPGRFNDARHVAVDGEGNIYAADYTGGRVQMFDPSGKFISLWMVDSEKALRGLAADRQGIVYVVQSGEILRYEGASGELLGKLQYAEGYRFDDVAVTADGGLVAAWRKFRDDLVRFDAQGNVVWTVQSAIEGQTGDAELSTRVAVDGLGHVYAMGFFNRAVFKFSPQGEFLDKFGSRGDEPGQFWSLLDITVDGRGRVYVGGSRGIQVFDSDGRYLDLIDVDGPPFGLVFSDQDELFVAARDKVIKYVLSEP